MEHFSNMSVCVIVIPAIQQVISLSLSPSTSPSLPLILARLQCILLTNLVVTVFKYSYSGYIIVSLSLIWWKWDNGCGLRNHYGMVIVAMAARIEVYMHVTPPSPLPLPITNLS